MFQGVLAVLREHHSQSVYTVCSSDTFVLFLKSCLMDQRIWPGERTRTPLSHATLKCSCLQQQTFKKNGCSGRLPGYDCNCVKEGIGVAEKTFVLGKPGVDK